MQQFPITQAAGIMEWQGVFLSVPNTDATTKMRNTAVDPVEHATHLACIEPNSHISNQRGHLHVILCVFPSGVFHRQRRNSSEASKGCFGVCRWHRCHTHFKHIRVPGSSRIGASFEVRSINIEQLCDVSHRGTERCRPSIQLLRDAFANYFHSFGPIWLQTIA